MAESQPNLREFLVEAKQQGYGSTISRPIAGQLGDKKLAHINYDLGLAYQDQWIGGNPYVGYEFVSRANKNIDLSYTPIWGMAYHGGARRPEDVDVVNSWLRRALPNPDPDIPIRGPLEGIEDDTGRYTITVDGDLEGFTAEELIMSDNRIIYVANFLGGLANNQ